jgi:hypothetical protein
MKDGDLAGREAVAGFLFGGEVRGHMERITENPMIPSLVARTIRSGIPEERPAKEER